MKMMEATPVQTALIGEWSVVARLPSGLRGEVYRVMHQISEQPAVLRLLPPGRSADDTFRSRFFRECDLAAQLAGPTVARVLGWGDHEGRVWCVTEALADGTLADRLHRGERPDGAEVLRIATQVARGLAAAHLAGLFHRGLQPSDILVRNRQPGDLLLDESSGRIAVAGFAVTSDLSGREAVSDSLEPPTSVACSSPERLRRKPTDQRSDLYSLGCVLYWATAGRPPFNGEPDEVARHHVDTMPTPLRIAAPDCPPGLDEIVTCLLRKDPQFRYPNAMALIEDLERVSRGGTANQARQIRSAETTRHSSATIPAGNPSASRSGILPPPPAPRARPWVAVVVGFVVVSAAGAAAVFSLRASAAASVPTPSAAPSPIAQKAEPRAADVRVAEPEPETFPPRSSASAQASAPVHPPEVAAPTAAAIAAGKAEAEAARIRALEAKIATMIKTGAHLGPVEDLTAQLGAPDLSENLGGRLWYGDYVFTVADGLVLGVSHHEPTNLMR